MSIIRTQIEEDYGHAFTEAEWKAVDALDSLADRLADLCCRAINLRAGRISREPVTYNEQWTLEKLIGKLEARV